MKQKFESGIVNREIIFCSRYLVLWHRRMDFHWELAVGCPWDAADDRHGHCWRLSQTLAIDAVRHGS